MLVLHCAFENPKEHASRTTATVKIMVYGVKEPSFGGGGDGFPSCTPGKGGMACSSRHHRVKVRWGISIHSQFCGRRGGVVGEDLRGHTSVMSLHRCGRSPRSDETLLDHGLDLNACHDDDGLSRTHLAFTLIITVKYIYPCHPRALLNMLFSADAGFISDGNTIRSTLECSPIAYGIMVQHNPR